MAKLSKKQKIANDKVEAGKLYSIEEASNLIKEVNYTKFDSLQI